MGIEQCQVNIQCRVTKPVVTRRVFRRQNGQQCVGRRGCAGPDWGSLQRSPDPLSGLRGKGRGDIKEGKETERKKEEWRERTRGKGRETERGGAWSPASSPRSCQAFQCHYFVGPRQQPRHQVRVIGLDISTAGIYAVISVWRPVFLGVSQYVSVNIATLEDSCDLESPLRSLSRLKTSKPTFRKIAFRTLLENEHRMHICVARFVSGSCVCS